MTESEITFEHLLEQYFFNHSLQAATEWSYRKVVRTFERYHPVLPAQVEHQQVLAWRKHVLQELTCEACTWNNKVTHMHCSTLA